MGEIVVKRTSKLRASADAVVVLAEQVVSRGLVIGPVVPDTV